jgi:hypothetical protein
MVIAMQRSHFIARDDFHANDRLMWGVKMYFGECG